jgi:tagatose 1,6-diphosphate aldolase GatY/KbaY
MKNFKQDGMSVSEKEAKMTDPSCVAVYIRDTKVDMLAVTIGNVHGQYTHPPRLDFPRLEAISKAVPFNFPLVLHGASGLPQDLIHGAISRGVCKFNVNTDLRISAMDYVKDAVMKKEKVTINSHDRSLCRATS